MSAFRNNWLKHASFLLCFLSSACAERETVACLSIHVFVFCPSVCKETSFLKHSLIDLPIWFILRFIYLFGLFVCVFYMFKDDNILPNILIADMKSCIKKLKHKFKSCHVTLSYM